MNTLTENKVEYSENSDSQLLPLMIRESKWIVKRI